MPYPVSVSQTSSVVIDLSNAAQTPNEVGSKIAAISRICANCEIDHSEFGTHMLIVNMPSNLRTALVCLSYDPHQPTCELGEMTVVQGHISFKQMTEELTRAAKWLGPQRRADVIAMREWLAKLKEESYELFACAESIRVLSKTDLCSHSPDRKGRCCEAHSIQAAFLEKVPAVCSVFHDRPFGFGPAGEPLFPSGARYPHIASKASNLTFDNTASAISALLRSDVEHDFPSTLKATADLREALDTIADSIPVRLNTAEHLAFEI